MTPKNKKVFFILPALSCSNIGGMEMVAKDLIVALKNEDYDFTVLCFSSNNGIIPLLLKNNISVKILNKEPGIDLNLASNLASFFAKERPALLHTLNEGALIYTRLAVELARAKSLFQWNAPIVHAEHGRIKKLESFLFQKIRIFMTKGVSHVVSVSEDLKSSLLAEGISEHKITVAINGVNTGAFNTPCPRQRIRNELGFSNKDWLIGTVGALKKIKNQINRINSPPKIPRRRGLLAGTGPIKEYHQQKIKSHKVENQVYLVGQRLDIPDFLRSLDVFTLPSIKEGTSLALLEAMAAELPVVATNVGGNPELVDHKQTGLLTKADDVDDLSNALNWMESNRKEAHNMGVEARKKVEQCYSFSKTANIYNSIFSKFITN